ncbi:hypothetical protein JR316_0012773 [Psilocybe cubensis]|uniref:Oxidase ustYa n=2 Tax=Psilocybe cubensis TaxID=181762 RepID=A0A8H7XRD6_PSICU|nr:hypothetical protein JR316_0012773 [Psilocybe cubensis]KAH9474315.1 hypothetical protein JR316_0012773 [Psilocybe cubensis]
MSRSSFLLILLAFLNVYFAMKTLSEVFSVHTDTFKETPYTYIGMDHPFYHPGLSMTPAALTLQETLHYTLNTSDPEGTHEWELLFQFPKGTGRVHLGSNHRLFISTFYHQLHCMVQLRRALLKRSDRSATPHHVNHCLQYLRQTLLCQADDTLEDDDFMEKDFQTQRIGSDVQCYDWEASYERIGEEYMAFQAWLNAAEVEQ